MRQGSRDAGWACGNHVGRPLEWHRNHCKSNHQQREKRATLDGQNSATLDSAVSCCFAPQEMAQDDKITPRRSARLAHAGSALKKLTTTAVKTIDDFVPLELTGNTHDKWMKMRANCDGALLKSFE